ncbi:MAG TPA: hypothetical protein VGF67_11990 [Ktedonobacteraceae bacterium]
MKTVFGCTGVRQRWARDLWHLRNRQLRGMLMHTSGTLFNRCEALALFNWLL